MNQFRLPDLGEGLAEAEIVQWHVKEGDEVAVDQVIVSLETAKAVVDVPSPFSGRISHLHGKPGDLIATGQVLVDFSESESEAPSVDPGTAAESTAGTVVGRIQQEKSATGEDRFWVVGKGPAGGERVQAMPAVRALARQLGVELSQLRGSGPNGQVLEQDVKAAFEAQPGQYELLRGARRSMAQTMATAFSTVAPVTLHDVADLSAWPEDTDISTRLIRAIAGACETEPSLNAWFDGQTLSRRLFSEVHVGVAIDSEHGLYVPVIEDVTSVSGAQLRERLDGLIRQVRARRLPQQQQAATITLSNFGTIAGRFATPAVIPPQVAIVGAGRLFTQPVEVDGRWHSHTMLPLSLTFDHRACTGGEAGRFMQALVADLEAP